MKTTTNQLPAVNFHLWEPCNFRCKYCFATFKDVKQFVLPKGHLPKEEAIKIVDVLSQAGFTKITFAGGEPTLCPWLEDLIKRAKANGLTTTIVTNGSGLNSTFLSKVKNDLDWVAISIDSVSIDTNQKIGRFMRSSIVPDFNWYSEKASLVKQFGLKLKINTVVNHHNYEESQLSELINKLQPMRWKIFQALSVKGQNDNFFHELEITEKQLNTFLKLNKISESAYSVVVENNQNMRGTYVMVDPAGRFYDNTKGYHSYSKPILEIGVFEALNQVIADFDAFVNRGGLYNWK